jgi:hypothetical protein
LAGKGWDGKREIVVLHDGRRFEGLIESADDTWLRLIQIHRSTGQPAALVVRTFERTVVAQTVRLPEADRAALAEAIAAVRHRAHIEAMRMEAVPLQRTAEKADSFRYTGHWFVLESNLEEATTRRVCARLEQVFSAYRQFLPPRRRPPRPVQVMVYGSLAEYRVRLERLGLRIPAPACFVPGENLVLAGSEMNRFAAEMARLRADQQRLESELKALRKRIPQYLQQLARQMQADGASSDMIGRATAARRQELEKELAVKEQELQRVGRENERKFSQLTGQMFAHLYHEGFHAYLENFVYPQAEFHVPPWLNEGLATVFEAAVLDGDTLRVDASHPQALKRLKADLAAAHPLGLERLLGSDLSAFREGQQSTLYYAYAWGLACHLTFELGLLGSPALDEYVRQAAAEVAPRERLERLVGIPLVDFESRWRRYIAALR